MASDVMSLSSLVVVYQQSIMYQYLQLLS